MSNIVRPTIAETQASSALRTAAAENRRTPILLDGIVHARQLARVKRALAHEGIYFDSHTYIGGVMVQITALERHKMTLP